MRSLPIVIYATARGTSASTDPRAPEHPTILYQDDELDFDTLLGLNWAAEFENGGNAIEIPSFDLGYRPEISASVPIENQAKPQYGTEDASEFESLYNANMHDIYPDLTDPDHVLSWRTFDEPALVSGSDEIVEPPMTVEARRKPNLTVDTSMRCDSPFAETDREILSSQTIDSLDNKSVGPKLSRKQQINNFSQFQ
jgi:hypothetical protein